MKIKELTEKQTASDTHNRFNSRPIEKIDLIKPILKYLKEKLEKKSLNSLRGIVFQILMKDDKVLERRIKLVYRLTMLKEKENFLKYKNRLAKKYKKEIEKKG